MASELLPCPFCGHDDSLIVEHVEGTIIHPAYYVRCDYCGAQGASRDRNRHVDAWNERALAAQPATVPETWQMRARFWEGAPWGEWVSFSSVEKRDAEWAPYIDSQWQRETRELYSHPAPQPEAQAGADDFEQWLDRDWPLWRNDPANPNVARCRRAWDAAQPKPAEGGAVDESTTRWMDGASRLLGDAGHGIHAAALATLAEGIRRGRVVSAPAGSGEAVAFELIAFGRGQEIVRRGDVASERLEKWRGMDLHASVRPLYAGAPPAAGQGEALTEVAIAEIIQNATGCGDSDSLHAAAEVVRRLAGGEGA
jgi:Lar family restriction alleviation protein